MQKYKFGESAIMPEGRPYMFSIEGTDAIYALTHTVDNAGRIHMAVDRANPVTDRRSMQDGGARRPVDDDDGDFDPHTGLLKDGRRLRVPMLAMDGRGTPSDPLVINTGLNLGKHFHPDGTPREPRRSRKTQQADATPTDNHRPHFADTDRSASEQARQQRIIEDSNAWRGPQAALPAAVTADAARPAGISDSDWAREQGIREMSDAWKPRDAAVPKVLPVGAWPDTIQTEGASCSVDGASGVWTRGADGFLYCKRKAMTSTRVPPTNPSTDARTMSAADAEAIKREAWNEMVAELNSAWKAPA
jgi:hypothetical protein